MEVVEKSKVPFFPCSAMNRQRQRNKNQIEGKEKKKIQKLETKLIVYNIKTAITITIEQTRV